MIKKIKIYERTVIHIFDVARVGKNTTIVTVITATLSSISLRLFFVKHLSNHDIFLHSCTIIEE